MDRRQHKHAEYKRAPVLMWGLILLAIGYSIVLGFPRPLTGMPLLEGFVGVALGLYICSHPAATVIKMLFYERYTLREISSEWTTLWWLLLNLLVLLAGWIVIFYGLVRIAEYRSPAPRGFMSMWIEV
jgi:hypothetical protein